MTTHYKQELYWDENNGASVHIPSNSLFLSVLRTAITQVAGRAEAVGTTLATITGPGTTTEEAATTTPGTFNVG